MNRDFHHATNHGSLHGQLFLPPACRGLVLFSPLGETLEQVALADHLGSHQLGTLSIPLLTDQEMHFPDAAYNVPHLAQRLVDILDRIRQDGDTENLPLGLFAPGPAAPAALRVAVLRDVQVRALACLGGLIDQAGLENLRLLAAPLLMVTEGDDKLSQVSFQRAAEYISSPHQLLRLPPGEGPVGQVARWFGEHLQAI